MAAFVRPFETQGREVLLQIGAETAFFGAPIEAYMEDRRIFMDGFYACYTDFEPQHAWVACAVNPWPTSAWLPTTRSSPGCAGV